MKAIIIICCIILLIGCETDIASNHEATEDSNMFTKRKTESYVIFSPMEGTLMQDGKPLPNTKIIRRLRWNGNDEGLVEKFLTDDKGQFSLPVHKEDLALGMLNQFVASTKLEAKVAGEVIDVWYNNKFENELFVETGGEISGLVCDLVAEEVVLDAGLSRILTICRWKNMPEPEM